MSGCGIRKDVSDANYLVVKLLENVPNHLFFAVVLQNVMADPLVSLDSALPKVGGALEWDT